MDYSFFFFFKQKTAYEMRISDWSSDVCSSDLRDWAAEAFAGGPWPPARRHPSGGRSAAEMRRPATNFRQFPVGVCPFPDRAAVKQIGRASCRERVCQYV